MDKQSIISVLLQKLKEELKRQQAANKQAAAGATDSESRAESKWDTQGLEASYLARGYARQFASLVDQAEHLRGFEAPDFSGKPIGLGALVKCDLDGFVSYIFLLPGCGGMDIMVDGHEITVVTPESPLGVALVGKRKGDAYTLPSGAKGSILGVE